jgi:hypothetical protein
VEGGKKPLTLEGMMSYFEEEFAENRHKFPKIYGQDLRPIKKTKWVFPLRVTKEGDLAEEEPRYAFTFEFCGTD